MRRARDAHGTLTRLPSTMGAFNPRRSASVILIVSGVGCLALCALMFYKLMPQEGRPPSKWTGSDTRGTVAAMVLLVMLLAGVGLLLKGVFS
jgi:hypothetical protein